MGKKWDEFTPKSFQEFSYQWGTEALRVLKPGAYCLAFSGTRTYHRMTCGLEDAGFTIKDMIMWCYGSGFPKSLDISKAIDKHLGKEREVIGKREKLESWNYKGNRVFQTNGNKEKVEIDITQPATPEALKWDGWGTALKPSFEPVVVAQKPYIGTYAENVLKYGVGGLNIGKCRIGYQATKETDSRIYNQDKNVTRGKHGEASMVKYAPDGNEFPMYNSNQGRFPSNLLLTHHPECVLKGTKNVKSNGHWAKSKVTGYGKFGGGKEEYHGKGIIQKHEMVNAYSCHPECPIRILDEQSGESMHGIDNSFAIRRKLAYGGNLEGGMYKIGEVHQRTGYNDKGGSSRFFKQVNYNDSFIRYDPLFKSWQKKMLGDILESQTIDGIVNGVIKEVEKCILNLNTVGYGNRILEKYLKGMLFTIKILTKQIMNSKISNYYLRKNIEIYIIGLEKIINSLKELNIEDVNDVKNIKSLQNIINELLEHMEVIVKNVVEILKENGKKKIESMSMNMQENGEKSTDRFIYCGKAHKSERNAGLEDLVGGYNFDNKEGVMVIKEGRGHLMQKRHMYCGKCGGDFGEKEGGGRKIKCKCKEPQYEWKVDPNNTKNNIATLKPINVMRYLVRLVCPPNGTVLDPFAGSGTTGIACIIEGFNCILIEKRERFAKLIIPKRLKYWKDPNHWEILKDKNSLEKVNTLKNKKQNVSMENFL